MKAIRYHKHGTSDVLRYEEVETPQIGPNDVLVKVKTCGVNYVDILARDGKLPVKIALPRIPGVEITGEVVERGDMVDSIDVGQAVVALSRVGCGRCEYCLTAEENICINNQSLGLNLDGGYAEYTCIPVKNIVPLPNGVSFLDAAGAPLSGLTAWHMLVTRAQVKAGEDVLILAAGSGIGSIAVQIAKFSGARVIATAGSDVKLTKAKTLGADVVINHREQDIYEEVRRITNKRGVDVVFEHVGTATWEKSIASLARNGRLVTCGAHTGHMGTIDIWRLFSKQVSLLGSYYGTKRELVEVLKLISQGKLRTIIHQVFPLDGAHEAQRAMETRSAFGKLVLEMN
ncbi:MAG: zinc-binding dehydrogenase [Candidatus Tectomicrobia bacterium]|nr:zinc-binding dehydrogenase [Candidatus Tectomicrobia bacterium]